MEEVNEPHGQEQTETSEGAIINIGNDPVMQSAVDVLSTLGNKGKVMGVDTSFVEEIPGVHIVKASVDSDYIAEEVFSFFGKKVNAVICDLSPQVTGNWAIDHSRQISLNYAAEKIMEKVLEKKGNALFKVFDGEYSNEFYQFMKKKFSKSKLTKPKASRKPSSELYCTCLGYSN